MNRLQSERLSHAAAGDRRFREGMNEECEMTDGAAAPTVGVIGLGYVGLSYAVAFAEAGAHERSRSPPPGGAGCP